MGFSIAVWNVEKFKAAPQRVQAVGQLIAKHAPDVFGILEFLDKNAARRLVRGAAFAGYDFAFTDSEAGIEILVGCKRGVFAQTLFTQRRELQVGNRRLRPGGLLSVLEPGASAFTNILFLHTDSGRDATAFRNRRAMFGKIWSLRRALAALPEQGGKPRLIALGDLNTMGVTGGASGAQEIASLQQEAQQQAMRMLPKTHEHTWSSDGRRKSNLDHVLASTELRFKTPAGAAAPAEVLVDGWVNRSGQERLNFVRNISDHALLMVALA
jgi:hypothetical protein